MRYFSFLLLILSLLSCGSSVESDENLPNILLILTDDQAYGDLSYTENPYLETPNIDKLASTGLFANHFYVSPVCAPTRASLLTGRYHQRTGVSGVTRGREDMKLDELTMADIFKSFGYKTGVFGKWHNGAHYPYHPLGRGFDEFVGFTSGHWSNYFDTTIEKNGEEFKTEGYLSDVLTDEAISFIERNSNDNKPFFTFLTYQTPHTPLQVPDKYFDKYKSKGIDDFNATIYGMIENIDFNIGRIQSKLKQLEIEENTIIIYISDNGPLNFRFNHKLKGKKGWEDEGGVRVPFILNWKGEIKGGVVLSESLAHIDLLPTLLDLIDKEYEYPNKIDGLSFKGLLERDTIANRILFNEWSGKRRALEGDFLMINDELFNLKNDPQQKVNVRSKNKLVYSKLNKEYEKWYTSLELTKQPEKFIPIGYDNYPLTILPAHEANLMPPFEQRKDRRHTGIAYHSQYGWAHDWVDYWTSTDAFLFWNLDIVKEGTYEVEISYALEDGDKGVELELRIGEQMEKFIIDRAFKHSEFVDHDRVKREQEAPETDWTRMHLGSFNLEKGKVKISLKSLKIPGEKSIELKDIRIRLIK